jgi:DNA mismatch repair protein MutL
MHLSYPVAKTSLRWNPSITRSVTIPRYLRPIVSIMSLTDTEIQILPDFIANQIAAGEVVQRPESVVKELVENSLDAGATEIVVIVRGAGKQLLHIIDNGKGMSERDLLLAPKRHATSKIKTAEDLSHIMTLGFRGEALASIFSVAQVEMRTRRKTDEHGWKLLSEPLQEPTLEPCSMEAGTQVFVRNLFYNVPARRKFLRSDLTEFRHIADTMTRFALSRPDVRFVFYDDDALIYDLAPAQAHERITSALGKRFADTLMRVDFSEHLANGSDIHITGFIGQPHFAKRTKAEQFFYMNGRVIASRQLSHAAMSAYEHLIDQSSYPPFVLFLAIDPERVDVNIHPQKHEVKFDDDRTIYTAVRRAVAETLARHNLTPSAQFRATSAFPELGGNLERMTLSPQHPSERGESVMVNRDTGEIMGSSGGKREPEPRYAPPSERRMTQGEISAYEQIFGREKNFSTESRQASAFQGTGWQGAGLQGAGLQDGASQRDAFGATSSNAASSQSSAEGASQQHYAPAKFFWQLHRKYIVMPTASGMVVIDQHAAHERILYERALKAMNEGFKYGQELLFPVNVPMTSGDAALTKELLEDLRNMGFDLALVESGVEIRGVPADVRTGREEDALRELLEQYREYNDMRHTSVRDNLAASFGCRSAIRAGDGLTFQEMRQLTEDLYAAKMPYTCPHGRPTVIEIPLEEFDKRFGRS